MHCGTGVARTGVFVAVDSLIDQYAAEGSLSPPALLCCSLDLFDDDGDDDCQFVEHSKHPWECHAHDAYRGSHFVNQD